MNILEVTSAAGTNGAVVHALLLSRELASRGHRVTVVCRSGSWIEGELRGTPVQVLPSDLRVWPADEIRRVARFVNACGIDVVHTHLSQAHLFGVLLKWFCGVPVIATAHSRRIQPHWMFNDRVIAVSECVRRFERRYNRVAAARLRVIPPFIDVARFVSVSDAQRRAMRGSLGIAGAAPVIGAVGAIFKEKRVLEIVRAFARVLSEVPQAHLVLVGDGSAGYVRRVRRESESLGVSSHVIWTGHRRDVPEIMSALDLLVLASGEESFSLVIAEAMAAGLPVVANRVGGVAETMTDGVHGILVRPGDRRAFVDAIVRLLEDQPLRQQFGEAGRARALECFSPAAQLGKIEALFEEVRETRQGRRRGRVVART